MEGRRAVDWTEKGKSVGGGGGEFVAWVEKVLDLTEVCERLLVWTKVVFDHSFQAEHQLLSTLAILPGGLHFPATYATLIAPLNSLFTSYHSQLLNTIKQSLHKHTFLALSTYSALSSPQISSRWDDIMQRRAGRSAGGTGGGVESRNQNALRECLHALRGVCLRSFPEFLADVKLAAMSTTVTAGLTPSAIGSVQTGVVDITQTVRVVCAIPHDFVTGLSEECRL